VLDRSRTLPMTFDPSAAEPTDRRASVNNEVCVRDVSWHPQVSSQLGVEPGAKDHTGTGADECSMGEPSDGEREHGCATRVEGASEGRTAGGLGGDAEAGAARDAGGI
jgi:hypothetical protein